MSEATQEDLLARLAGKGGIAGDPDSWAAVAATVPEHQQEEAREADEKLDEMLGRIQKMAHGHDAVEEEEEAPPRDEFVPIEPTSFAQAGLTDTEVASLILKYLLAIGDASGRVINAQICLPFTLVDHLLRQMKDERLIAHKGAAAMNDYVYMLTDHGRERARRLFEHCTYFGSAPVSLTDYIASVKAQSIAHQHPDRDSLVEAFHDLILSDRMMSRLGPAINSGRGLFLFGAPGNGKTSIAERVTGSFGQVVWIPRSLGVDGDIIRMFDPMVHQEMPVPPGKGLLDKRKIDSRWVRIRRPTIVVGGELTMAQLEVTLNTATNISEAPVQLKSNTGTLVIDDFGRQRMSTDELLNRWIVPLEMRYDFLNLPNGKKVQVPFDQLIIFSTNLEPRDLVDDAFLRRIPYKIEVVDPDEDLFRDLMKMMAPKLGFRYRDQTVDYLIETHYRQAGRPLRCCHPRDLLFQVRNYCLFHKLPLEMTNEYFDFAVENYFAVM